MSELTQEQIGEIENRYEEAERLYSAAQYDEAAAIYYDLAERGYFPAWCKLGICCISGKGVDRDYAKAAEIFRYVADSGYYDGHICLGVCYELGIGIAQDKKQARAQQDLAVAAFGKEAKKIYKLQLDLIKKIISGHKIQDALDRLNGDAKS